MLGLGECGTHAIIAAELGPISAGERELAQRVLADLEQGMLVIFDRGFYSYDFFAPARRDRRGAAVPGHRQPETAGPATAARRLLPVRDHRQPHQHTDRR